MVDTLVELEINLVVEVATRLDEVSIGDTEATDEDRTTVLENRVKRRRSPQISALLPGQGIAHSLAGAETLPAMREFPQ